MWYYYLISVFVLAIDQFAKWVVVQNMQIGESITVISGFLYWRSYRNDGAAWSMFQGKLWFFYIVTILVIIVVIYMMQYAKGKPLFAVSLALILGGALGNFIDRITRQEVVDFISTVWGNYYFPIFNIADISLSVGVLFTFLYVFLDGRKGNKK